MQNPRTIGRPRSFTYMKSPTRVTAGIIAAMIGVCGAGSAHSPTPPPVARDASVTGQYNLVLTSTTRMGVHGKRRWQS
jgi:hypothetical protein